MCNLISAENQKAQLKMAFGDYPVEYNPKTHGVYDPARFYGKRKYQSDANLLEFHRFLGKFDFACYAIIFFSNSR